MKSLPPVMTVLLVLVAASSVLAFIENPTRRNLRRVIRDTFPLI